MKSERYMLRVVDLCNGKRLYRVMNEDYITVFFTKSEEELAIKLDLMGLKLKNSLYMTDHYVPWHHYYFLEEK